MTEIVLLSLFLPPVVVVILANVIILGMVIGVLISPTAERHQKQASDKAFINNIRMSLKGCLALLPLLGITWLLAFLQVNSDSPVMSYVFVLLSCSQGVFFFVSNIVLNQEVCTALKRFLKRYHARNIFRSSSSPSMQYSFKGGDFYALSVSRRATAYSNESFSLRKSFVKTQREAERVGSKLYAPNTQIKKQWQAVNDY